MSETVEISIPHNGWLPRDHQDKLWDYLTNGGDRAVAIWHRRAGKDEVCLHFTALSMLRRPGNYWICNPEYSQSRKSIWTAINPHTGLRRIDEAFPQALRETTQDQEMLIRFKNGSTVQCIGSDSYNRTVGSSPAGIVYSEYALSNPSAWAYHRPMLQENGGWAVFITTPRGHNHAKAMYDHALKTPGWFAELLTAEQTGAMTPAQLEEARDEYIDLYGDIGQAAFDQEYNCSFNAAIIGAFYAREMAAVRNEGRIIECEALPDRPVHTCWDLGVKDDTSIWMYQAQGAQLVILDHLAASGVGVEWYRDELFKRFSERGWMKGDDYVPHDAKIKEWGSGRTRVETMSSLGLKPLLVPLATIDDGINAVRRVLPLCVFHPRTEVGGISALEQYRREWDDEKKTFRASAVHDWSSHPCLVGETLIEIDRGLVPIKDVRAGDLAKTPAGWAWITAAGPTKRATELIEVRLADGRTLRGTPQHKIFTERGLVTLDTLRYSDTILSEGSATWQKTLLYSKAGNTGFRDAITDVITGATRGRRQTFTERFGRIVTAQFQRGLTSTISMVTGQITICPTLSYSSAGHTPDTTPQSELSAANCTLHPHLRLSGRPSGTPQKKVLSGIARTASASGKLASGISSIVRSAVANINRRIKTNPNFVTSIARCRPSDAGEERPLVYDLTVEKHHCYLANGILVSNCDAFRYLAMSYKAAPRVVARQPIMEGWRIPPPAEPSRRGGIIL